MKGKIRKNIVFALFFVHFAAYFMVQIRSFVVPAILGMVLGDMFLSAVQLRLFIRTNSDVRTYLRDFWGYLVRKAPVLAGDFAVYLLTEKQNHAGSMFWLAVCGVTALLCAFVALVTGIARTALYHKEK